MNLVIKEKQPIRLVVCLPGSNFSSTFLIKFTEFMRWCYLNNIEVVLSPAESSVVYYVRNMCLGGDVLKGIHQKPFQGKVKYDYMLWIDSDSIFTINHFSKLLEWNKDIVSGIYMMKNMVHFATVKDWNVEYFKKNGVFQFLSESDLKDWKKGLMEVAYTGLGFMLIKYGVFESLEYPWFRPLWQELGDGIRDFSSEDVSFCQEVSKKGYRIYIDPTVRVGHEKKVTL